MREYRKVESARVEQGKKPYFLKEKELKRRATEKSFEAMGKSKRQKALEKQTKRKAQREMRMMPEIRRRVDR